MWKILLAFCTHRFFLLLVAFLSINYAAPLAPGQKLLPVATLWNGFAVRAAQAPEVTTLQTLALRSPSQVFGLTTNPLLWLSRWVLTVAPVSPLVCLLILSNLFCLLFLWELFSLLSRFALSEVAASAGILAVLWVTSYELSLGSTLSLVCWLTTFSLRLAIDNQWLPCGLALAILGLTEPLVLGLAPLLFYLFWYFQRHLPLTEVIKRSLLLSLPLILVVIWRWGAFRYTGVVVRGSAFFDLVGVIQGHQPAKWLFAGPNLTQTIALLFFLVGAVAACVVNHTTLHRIMPLYLLLVVLAFSTYETLASRLMIAAVCLEGVTAVSAGILIRLVQLLLIVLSVAEVFSIFH